MPTPSLPISTIIPVSVVLAPVGTPGPTFNEALVVGSSPNSITAAQRLQQVTGVAGATALGYATTSPEYIWLQIYFAQAPAPTYAWLGIQILTALQTVGIGTAGTGYAVGDILTVATGTGGTLTVTSIGGSGAVTGISILTQGSGYAIANGVATTGGSGSGAQVNVTAIGETPAQAIAACRAASPVWYCCSFVSPAGISGANALGTASSGSPNLTVASVGGTIAIGQVVVGTNVPTGTTIISGSGTSWVMSQNASGALSSTALVFYAPTSNTDKAAIALFIESATPPSTYLTTSGDAAVLANTPGNLFATLQAAQYNRTLGVYTTTQGGAYQNNPHASAAVAGVAMGNNTGNPGSYFALAYKQLTGITPEPLSANQLATIAGTPNRSSIGLNGNVYINYSNSQYFCLDFGTCFSGRFFDITLFLDMLVSQIQTNAMNLLVSSPAVPLTNSGIAQMQNVITQACVNLQSIGFIAPSATWNGVTIGNVTAGTPLPKGYLVIPAALSSLSPAQRAARQFPPINVLICLAQAGMSLAVSINVQQ